MEFIGLRLYVKNVFDDHNYVRRTDFGDGLSERTVGGYPAAVPELVGIADLYGNTGAAATGQFTRKAVHGNVPRDFDRYIGSTFEMKF